MPLRMRSSGIKKFEANKRKDELALISLQNVGWRTAVVWECAMGPDVSDDLPHRIKESTHQAKGRHRGDDQSNRENW